MQQQDIWYHCDSQVWGTREISLPPDKCPGQLFIVHSRSSTCFLVPCLTKLCAEPGRRSDYRKTGYLMVIELWLMQNENVLSCKPDEWWCVHDCSYLWEIHFNQKWVQTGSWCQEQLWKPGGHHCCLREGEMLAIEKWMEWMDWVQVIWCILYELM